MPSKIEISYKTILFTIFIILFLIFLYQIRGIIFLIFVGFIMMSALNPITSFFEKFNIPRTFSVLIVYLGFLSLLVFFGSSIIPSLITQSVHLGEKLTSYFSNYFPFTNFLNIDTIIHQAAPIGQNFLKMSLGIFNNIIGLFTLFVISFYMVIEREKLEVRLTEFIGESGAKQLLTIIHKVEERLGSWIRGEVSLMIIIGLMTFIGLQLLNIPYVLPLAIIAGILELIPTVGPIISAIPAILIALTISPLMGLAVAALYFIIQQLENQLIVPLVMKQAVGLPPLVTLISLMIGANLAGIIGAILAVPIVVTIETIISEYLKLKNIH